MAALLARLAAREDRPLERVMTGAEAARAGGFPEADFVAVLRPRRAGEASGNGAVAAVGGEHGYLPDDRNMDAAFLIAGPGVPRGLDLGRIDMRDVAPTLAGRAGLRLPGAEGRDRLSSLSGLPPVTGMSGAGE